MLRHYYLERERQEHVDKVKSALWHAALIATYLAAWIALVAAVSTP